MVKNNCQYWICGVVIYSSYLTLQEIMPNKIKTTNMKKGSFSFLLINWVSFSMFGAYLKITHSLYYLGEII